ncbi:hypothetical protein SDC9_92480 [bioreactor metagenome]|uniref:Uncharacterized protein n=1 Tax=bioreactor metagenome TaxID=1076179 RepID=A0A644ZZB4_9ZZZZ
MVALVGKDFQHPCYDELEGNLFPTLKLLFAIGKLNRNLDGAVDMKVVDIPLHGRGEGDEDNVLQGVLLLCHG